MLDQRLSQSTKDLAYLQVSTNTSQIIRTFANLPLSAVALSQFITRRSAASGMALEFGLTPDFRMGSTSAEAGEPASQQADSQTDGR